MHVSAEGGLQASKINCANNSCPQKDKAAGVGIGSQSWPGLLKREAWAGRNPGLDPLGQTAPSDPSVLEGLAAPAAAPAALPCPSPELSAGRRLRLCCGTDRGNAALGKGIIISWPWDTC